MNKRKSAPHVTTDFPKLAKPAQQALHHAGLQTLAQLTKLSEVELLQLHGMGQSALGQLRQALAGRGLSFRGDKKSPEGQMNKTIRAHLDNLRSDNRQLQNTAYFYLMAQTEQPVDWAYAAWDELLEGLKHKDNHVRAISAQLLANLAKSDPQGRMLKNFKALLAVTQDERFVTARHCLQSLWKVGIVGQKQQQQLVEGLTHRFKECVTEKNCTLIRSDILQSLRKVYDQTKDEKIRERALELIETEVDSKYRKKYATLWRPVKALMTTK